jgi:hypothetical protein
MSEEHLMKHCVDLETFLNDTQAGKADIDGLQIMEELDASAVF